MRVSMSSVKRSRAKTALLSVLLAATAGLGACETMQGAMGIGKLPPDEYAVAPRRPLAMPPDYELRAPQPGAVAPADINASGVAARALATTGGAGATQPAAAPPPPATDAEGRVLTTEPPATPTE